METEEVTAEKVFKPTIAARREETHRAYAAIVDEERRARIAKDMRLRSMRLTKS